MIPVGQKFLQERVKKGLTIDDVARATKIRASFLSAIEKGDYKKLPSSAYAAGFVKNYATYLGLPSSEISALFRREFDEKKVFEVLPKGLTQDSSVSLTRFRFNQGAFLVIVLFLILLAYIGFGYRYAFISPPLNVSSPKENQVFKSADIQVLGKTDQNATVYINDVATSVNQNGEFKKTITLFSGKETVTVRSVNSFGRQTTLTIPIEIKSQ